MSVPLGATIELFGNRNTGDTEGEIFLGEARIAATRTVDVFHDGRRPDSAACRPAFTATVTTTDGATSEFSRPVGMSD